LRAHYGEITGLGAGVVAIGTGNERYAAAFIREENIPFTVLVDDDARAADAASLRSVGWLAMLHPRTWRATVETWRRGHRVHKAGARVTQLGATFVLGRGDRVRYEHLDRDSTDHAPLAEVLAALRED
jgi:peroxiredoxin